MGNIPPDSNCNGHFQTVAHIQDSMDRLERALRGIDAGILFQANQLSKGTVTRENHDMMLYGAHVRCSNYVSVLAGPMVGYVGETNAVIVIEVNAPSTLTCYVSLRDASTPEGRLVTSKTVNVRPGIPSKFLIDNLIPGERYWYCFGGIRRDEVKRRSGFFRTWGGRSRKRVRIALIGDNGACDVTEDAAHLDMWGQLAEMMMNEDNDVQLTLHLGGQVHGVGHEISSGVWSSESRRRLESRMATEQYRCILNMRHTRAVYAHGSNLTLCGRGDRALGRREFRRYQHQLRFTENREGDESLHSVHIWGCVALFCFHVEGVDRWAGEARCLDRPIVSDVQLKELDRLLSRSEIRAVIVGCSIPLVYYSDSDAAYLRAQQKKKQKMYDVGLVENDDDICDIHHAHWHVNGASNLREEILDRLFAWKRASSSFERHVLIVSGGSPVGVETDIRDDRSDGDNGSDVSVRQISLGPISATPSEFLPTRCGHVGHYSFVHRPRAVRRSFATIDLFPYNATGPAGVSSGPSFDARGLTSKARWPWPHWPAISSRVEWYGGATMFDGGLSQKVGDRKELDDIDVGESTIEVRAGPIVGKVTPTTAVVLCEASPAVGTTAGRCQLTCRLVDALDGTCWVRTVCFERDGGPRCFTFEGLRPNREFDLLLEGNIVWRTDASTTSQRSIRSGIVRTPPLVPEALSVCIVCGGDGALIESEQRDPHADVLSTLHREMIPASGGSTAHVTFHIGQVAVWRRFGAAAAARNRAADGETAKDAVRDALRAAYRWQWSLPSTAAVLSSTSNILVPGREAISDRSETTRASATVPALIISSAAERYLEYQRQLWDPEWQRRVEITRLRGAASAKLVESTHPEYCRCYVQRFGSFGIFAFDLRDGDDDDDDDGCMVSEAQWRELSQFFRGDSLKTAIIVSESPFLLDSPEDAKMKRDAMRHENASRAQKRRGSVRNKRQWSERPNSLLRLLDTVFTWIRDDVNGVRRVVLVSGSSGGSAVALETNIREDKSERSVPAVRQIVCPPILSSTDSNSSSHSQMFERKGTMFGGRYCYDHVELSQRDDSLATERSTPDRSCVMPRVHGFMTLRLSATVSKSRSSRCAASTDLRATFHRTQHPFVRIDEDERRQVFRRSLPSWYFEIRRHCDDDFARRISSILSSHRGGLASDACTDTDDSATTTSLKRELVNIEDTMRPFEKRWIEAGTVGAGGDAAMTLRALRARSDRSLPWVPHVRSLRNAIAWRQACASLIESGCSGLERRLLCLPSRHMIELVLLTMGDAHDPDLDDSAQISKGGESVESNKDAVFERRETFVREVIRRCWRMMMETIICRAISATNDSFERQKIRLIEFERRKEAHHVSREVTGSSSYSIKKH